MGQSFRTARQCAWCEKQVGRAHHKEEREQKNDPGDQGVKEKGQAVHRNSQEGLMDARIDDGQRQQ
jgi:hypothetical protein